MTYDLITTGRISVDVYPQQIGVPLDKVSSFGKYLGGSPANVAVAAARYQRRTALISATGDDAFGDFLHQELRRYQVADQWVTRHPQLQTPVTFCSIQPPEDFPLAFYGRTPSAPDWEITAEGYDVEPIRDCRIFWSTLTGMAKETSREAQLQMHQARPRDQLSPDQHTVLDLDYRPMFWDSAQAGHEQLQQLLPQVSVVVGNSAECAVAVGEGSPDEQADRLLESGVGLAIVKRGSEGVLAATPDQRVSSAALAVRTVNGLGAGDAFGGALCHGLLAGWELNQVLDFANAAGAYVATQIACSEAMPTAEQVQQVLTDHSEVRQ